MGLIRSVVSLGVSDDLGEPEARRRRTINVVAVLAFVASVVTTTYQVVVINPTSLVASLWVTLIFFIAYGGTLWANATGRTGLAVWLGLGVGSVHIVVATFVVGFDQGPAPFFLVIAVTAVLITRLEDRFTRWFFISSSVIGYTVLAIISPATPPEVLGTGNAAATPIRQFLLMIGFAVGVVTYQRLLAHRAEVALSEANQQSESLLLNILPREVADRLRSGEIEIVDRVESVTVMFIDLVGSTRMAEVLPASALVDVLNDVFRRLDALTEEYGLEKIKTIGDAYMVVGGVPHPRPDHVTAVADMALATLRQFESYVVPGFGPVQVKIGVDTGPVVAGVIGRRKFSYDLWGRTVNTASRMQTTGVGGEIQVTAQVHDALGESYVFSGPWSRNVKGVDGEMLTYNLLGRVDDPLAAEGDELAPNP